MVPERTFGIEIECVSKISPNALAGQIGDSLDSFGHSCISTGFQRNTDGNNFSQWFVKTDSTVHTHDMVRWPYDHIEIVSPILQGEDGLKVLKAVCQVTEQYCTANKTCGLHVHHGIPSSNELGNIVIGWLRAEDTIYECLPKSRREGSYAMPLKKRATLPKIRRTRRGRISSRQPTGERKFNIPDKITNPAEWWQSTIADRKVGLNLESYWLRKTIEVRCAAGTVEFLKIKNWSTVTQRLIIQASKNPIYFQEGIENLAAALSDAVEVIGTGPSGDFHPSPNCGRGHAFWRLLESNEPLDIDELVWEVAERFGKDAQYGINRVKKAINLARKSGYVVERIGNRCSINYPQLVKIKQIYFEPDDVTWLRQRHQMFREVL